MLLDHCSLLNYASLGQSVRDQREHIGVGLGLGRAQAEKLQTVGLGRVGFKQLRPGLGYG